MTTRLARCLLLLGLGAVAGAVLPAAARAQVPVKRDTTVRRDTTGRGRVIPARPDDTRPLPGDTAKGRVTLPAPVTTIPLPARADSMIRNDSAAQGILGRPEQRVEDTLKAPLARGEAPPVLEIGAARVYDRQAIYATGALTLADLLSRVPGLTGFATGWTIAPTGVAMQGDFRAIRIFLDGLELDPMDQREQGRAPINELPMHMLEELRIERGSDEVRVYARSWRVSSTTPYTRADVLTGDQNNNVFRGYFGRRYSHGEALQVSAEQASTQPISRLPSADQRSFLARVGIARGGWSADVMAARADVNRGAWVGQGSTVDQVDTIAPTRTRRTTAYLRLARGDPDSSRWMQVVASTNGVTSNSAASGADSLADHDSTSSVNQYLVTGGLRRGPLRLLLAERLRAGAGRTSSVPSGRASLESELLSLSLFAEGPGPLRPARVELMGRAQLWRLVALGAVSRSGAGVFERVISSNPPTPIIGALGGYTEVGLPPVGPDTITVDRFELVPHRSARAEVGLRVRDVWVSGGFIHRGATTLLSAAGLGTPYGAASTVRHEAATEGAMASLRGRLWRGVNVDAWGLAWKDSTGLYRPKYQSRAELYLQTNLLDRFPRGNFGLLTSLAHEYRSNAKFPITGGDTVRTALGGRSVDFKLEIRIQSATISYQFRNLLQENRAQVPGFFLPRQTQVYGVRWEFWN